MTTNVPEFAIETGEVPAKAVNRPARPNPFDGKFPTPEGQAMIVTLPSQTEDQKKEVSAVVALAQKAAREAGFTGRVKRELVMDGKKEQTRLHIWSVKKIVHKPKDAEAASEVDAK